MTFIIGKHLIIEPTAHAVCEDCGQTDELRPYGPGGTNVCFSCGMKDPEGARLRFLEHIGLPQSVIEPVEPVEPE